MCFSNIAKCLWNSSRKRRESRLSRFCLLFAFCSTIIFTLSDSASARPLSLQTRQLELFYTRSGDSADKSIEATWDSFCNEFSRQFLVAKGPQGRGIFKRRVCRKLQMEADAPTQGTSDWRFHFLEEGSKLRIDVTYLKEPIFTYSPPEVLSPNLIFTNPVARQYLIGQIYRRLPVAWRIKLPADAEQWKLPDFDESQMPGEAPVSHLLLFKVTFDANHRLWQPTLKAVATRDQALARDSATSPATLAVEYQAAEARSQGPTTLWAQELYSEESEHNKSLLSLLTAIKPSVATEKVRENISLTALRYLKTFSNRQTAPSQTPKFEIAIKLQKAPLDGLSLSFENSLPPPETNEIPYHFYWSRQSLGWAVGLGLEGTLVGVASQFRLAPRIGLLSMNATFPAQTEESDVQVPVLYETKNQLELGAELSWQLQRKSYTLWISGMNSLSGYVLKKEGAAEVSNQRLSGIIHYRSPWRPFGVTLGLEALAYLDWISLKKKSVQEAVDDDASEAGGVLTSNVSLTVLYLGLGTSFSW